MAISRKKDAHKVICWNKRRYGGMKDKAKKAV